MFPAFPLVKREGVKGLSSRSVHPRIESCKLEPSAIHRDEWRELAISVRLVRLRRRRRFELGGMFTFAKTASPDKMSSTSFA